MGDRDRDVLHTIAVNVRRLRVEAGLSMSALARMIDDYPNAVERVEAEKNIPGAGLLARIAEALNVEPGDLFEPVKPQVKKKLANAS